MKTKLMTKSIVALILGLYAPCTANSWQTIYQTDFSGNPSWMTSDPTHYFWDSSDGTYYVDQVNINYGGNYAVTDTGHNGGSFRLQYDIKMLSTNYAGGLSFGLYDSDLNSNNSGSYAEVHFVREDRGHVVFLESKNKYDGHSGTVSTSPQFVIGTWYRVLMEYDEDNGTLTAHVKVRETGATLAYMSLSGVGPFASDMGLLGNSNIRDYTFQVPGAHCTAKVDNVSFAVMQSNTEPIVAQVNIDPDVLSLSSVGKWITCHITLPEQYQVSDIDPATILLEEQVAPTWSDIDEIENVLTVKFERVAVQSMLQPGKVELMVMGTLRDGTFFAGTDTIMVLD